MKAKPGKQLIFGNLLIEVTFPPCALYQTVHLYQAGGQIDRFTKISIQ